MNSIIREEEEEEGKKKVKMKRIEASFRFVFHW